METLSLFTEDWGHFDGLSDQNVTGAVSSLLCDGSMTSGLCILAAGSGVVSPGCYGAATTDHL